MKLIPLERQHIELVRIWRNSVHVRQWMFWQHPISCEQQKTWFATLPKKDVYRVIEVDGMPVGMCNLKNVIRNQCAEAGIFIGNPEYLNGLTAMRAMLMLYDMAFKDIMLKYIIARVLHNNDRAIKFNRAFGFRKIHGSISPELLMMLDAKTYKTKRVRYNSIVGEVEH